MFKKLNILDEKDPHLRKISENVIFPLTKEEKDLIQRMVDHLTFSQIEEYEKKYDLRPGMGLAAIQLGVAKRYFVVVHEVEEGTFDTYVIINPKIISNSEEMIYVELGEGCLSINRDVEGIVPRYARVTIEGYNELGQKITVRGREELAIAFQHEIDHLNGILFTDHIDKDNPYAGEELYRAI